MSKYRLIGLAAIGVAILLLPACGGGGQGLRTANDPVKVTSTSLPSKMSGETMNHVIPLDGGCGGPYVLKVISGRMPLGLELDNETHAIQGYLGEDGTFQFTIEVTDTGCNPFSTTTASFTLNVGVGPITIVGVRKDGNPGVILPPGEAYSPADERPIEEQDPYNPDYPALPDTIFNEYTLLDFVVAGGKGPYEISMYDDPSIDDMALPLGTSIIEKSTSVAGTPIEEATEGAFLLTFEITDSLGQRGQFTAYWLVYSPPLIIATTSLPDGVCGTTYTESMFIAGGIPPFYHQFVDAIDSKTQITSADYPAPANPGPNYAAGYVTPPEGLYIEEDTGNLRGIPRRRGTFKVVYQAYSTLLPASPRQNRWQELQFSMAQAADPLAQNGEYTLDGNPFAASAPYNRLPEIEVGSPYNPDAATHAPPGLQALAQGGVPFDGLTDHPHYSQILADPTPEVEGSYEWVVDWLGAPMPGMEFTIDGIFRIADENALVKANYRDLAFEVQDQALPTALRGTDKKSVRVSVGPDTVFVTTSTTSYAGGQGNNSSYDNIGMDDREMTVKLLMPFKSGAELKTLSASRDLSGTGSDQHTIPATAGSFGTADPLDTLLTKVDFFRTSVNPNGWWNDVYNLNPRGARGMQHTDANRASAAYHSNAYAYDYQYKYSSGSYSYSSVSQYGAQPETASVHIPDCTAPDSVVAHDPDKGVHKDGGKMYVFDGKDYFGVFMIRENGTLYVPVAIERGASSTETLGRSFECFGDNVQFEWSKDAVPTVGNIPQMTVSPDGRFAAMKLMTDVATFGTSSSSSYAYAYDWTGDNAAESAIVLFSLTGEKPWGGKPYKIIGTGSNGSTSYGQVMRADTMTLTNGQLYYVCGNKAYYSPYSWREQYVYRYDVLSGGSAGELLRDDTGAASANDPEWTNAPGEWMQVPCGRTDRYFYTYSYSYSGSYSYSYSYKYPDGALIDNGSGIHEGSTAPVPFRVNADGDSCVIIAGRKTAASGSSVPYGGTDWHMHHVFVDYDDGSGPTLYRLSSKRRRIPQGTGRGYMLHEGYHYYTHHWGSRTGPTPNVEISDDGSKVAVCVSRVPDTTAIFGYNSYSYSSYYGGYNSYGQYSSGNWTDRQDIILFEQKSGSAWSSTGASAAGESEVQVTGAEGGTPVFSTSVVWRFGSLVFTKENDGLVFWAGFASYSPTYSSRTSSNYYNSPGYVGSFYSYDFDSGDVANMLASTDGGANLTVGSAQSTIGSSWTSARTTSGGTIKPVGGFLSKNREYLYVCSAGALTTSKKENLRLVGFNVNSLSGDSTDSGHTEGEGFAVGNWPDRRGFTVFYGASSSYPYMWYGIGRGYGRYPPGGVYGAEVVMAKESGWVFFGAHYQLYGGSSTTTYYQGPILATYTNYYPYNAYRGQVAVFDADVGGDVYMISDLSEDTSTSYSSAKQQFVKYIEPSADGRSLAYVYGTSSYYYYQMGQDMERIGFITSLDLDPDTGELDEATKPYKNIKDLAGSQARVATSVTPGPFGEALYWAYGSSNENAKTLYKRREGDTTDTDFGLGTARWNILHASR